MIQLAPRPVESPEQFAATHFAGLDLGDRRRSRRAVGLAASLAAAPSASIPKACGSFGAAKAAYRLVRADGVTPDSITASHRSIVRREMRRLSEVLLVQDTTEVSYGTPGRRRGLGPIGHGHAADGFLLHTALAIDPNDERAVLGAASIACWARRGVRPDEPQAARRARPDRESLKWSRAVEDLGSPPPGARWIHVCDREGDVFELYRTCVSIGADCLVRSGGSAAARRAVLGHEADTTTAKTKATSLSSLVRAREPMCGTTLTCRREGRETRIPLSVSWCAVTLLAPKLLPASTEPIRMWAVRVWSASAKLEWILLTTVRTESEEDALRVARWYSRRWTAEEYHKCLKTGCAVEARQLEDGDALQSLCAMLAVVAIYLLSLRTLASSHPDAPAEEAVPREYVEAMSLSKGIAMGELTCSRFLRELGRMGGHLGRRSDGPPGWKTLMLGWRDLQMIAIGIRIAEERVRSG
jgi:hypothetical protein